MPRHEEPNGDGPSRRGWPLVIGSCGLSAPWGSRCLYWVVLG
jgi:hypothetical protein